MWNRAVTIKVNGQASDHQWAITSTKEAAYYLLDRWPGERDVAFKRAVLGCKRALRGEISDQLARFSFQSAAQSARILVGVTRDLAEADEMVADLYELATLIYAEEMTAA